jgi:hypothetical protein
MLRGVKIVLILAAMVLLWILGVVIWGDREVAWRWPVLAVLVYAVRAFAKVRDGVLLVGEGV